MTTITTTATTATAGKAATKAPIAMFNGRNDRVRCQGRGSGQVYWIIQDVRQGEKKDQHAKNRSTRLSALRLTFAANDPGSPLRSEVLGGGLWATKLTVEWSILFMYSYLYVQYKYSSFYLQSFSYKVSIVYSLHHERFPFIYNSLHILNRVLLLSIYSRNSKIGYSYYHMEICNADYWNIQPSYVMLKLEWELLIFEFCFSKFRRSKIKNDWWIDWLLPLAKWCAELRNTELIGL